MHLYVLSLHLIFVVTWFAGLFYIVRLFVYHAEAEKKPEPEKSILQNQYKIMEKRLWYGIAWPSAVAALLFGTWMVLENLDYLLQIYFILKLCFVGGLVLYHMQCHVMFTQFQKGIVNYSPFKLRLWNEVATIFLVAIIFIIVLKNSNSFVWGLLGLVICSAVIFGTVYLLKKSREKKEN